MTPSPKAALKATASTLAALALLAGCRDSASSADTAGAGAVESADLLSEPPIWSVLDDDSEVILYGTVHILPEGVEWQSERLDAALARAAANNGQEGGGEIWYELSPEAMADPAFQQTVMELGMDPSAKLSELLPAPTREKLEMRLAELEIPMAVLESMRPWMAAVSLPTFQLMKAGYSGEEGVETKLQARADTSALGQRALETPEQQMRFFADMDEDRQIVFLDQTLDEMEEGTALLDRLAEAWASGDVDTLETEFITEMKDYPELYDMLIVERNTDWAAQLDAEMKGAGVDFVAVGAGHLVGPDSVPAMMAAKGYEVELLTVE